jgi:hypothetical protein
MRAIVALLTVAATAAGCAAAQTAGGVRGTVATVDWPNGLVLLRDVRSAETGEPLAERRPAGGGAMTTVQRCDGGYTFAAGTNFGKCAKAAEGGAKPTETE